MIPILDGHNDTLLNLIDPGRGKGRNFFEESETGHIDLPRARRGGFAGGFFAMFAPAPENEEVPAAGADADPSTSFLASALKPIDPGYAMARTFAMARLMYRIAAESGGEATVVKDVDTLKSCIKTETLAMIFHIEGAEAIDESLDLLYVLYEAGLRSLGIVWSRPNLFGHGVPFSFPGSPDTGPGLTEAGRGLVQACNDLGIMVDVSHLNEKGFWDVVRLSSHPVVATHSCVHALCQSPRNLTDGQMDAIRDSDGVMGINFHVGFLREDGRRDKGTPLGELARHIDYAVDRMGTDHVALGSDFDGATMPEGLGDVAGLPRLIDLLKGRGYSESDLRKIGYENWIRVLKKTWR